MRTQGALQRAPLVRGGSGEGGDEPATTGGQPVQVDLLCHHCGQPVTHDTIHAELADA